MKTSLLFVFMFIEFINLTLIGCVFTAAYYIFCFVFSAVLISLQLSIVSASLPNTFFDYFFFHQSSSSYFRYNNNTASSNCVQMIFN